MIDELRIITDHSPVLGPNRVENPAEWSTFQLLLSGEDASTLLTGDDPAESRRRIVSRLEFLGELIEALPAVDRAEAEMIRSRELELRAVVSDLTAATRDIVVDVDSAKAQLQNVEQDIIAERSRLIMNQELLQRFRLLEQSYQSDIQRLGLINEGVSVLSALPVVPCPLCGNAIGSVEIQDLLEDGDHLRAQVSEACFAEQHKAEIHLRSLEGVIETVSQEAAESAERLKALDRRYTRLRDQLSGYLSPRHSSMMERLQAAIESQSESTSFLIAAEQRASLIERRLELQSALQKLPAGRAKKGGIQVDTGGFTGIVQNLLAAWHYPELTKVTYDRATDDLIVSGEARSSHGKGVRAILYAAFVIALMRYCRAAGTGHPGFVVLDSPLTTYRRPDSASDDVQAERPKREDEISPDMQSAFWASLAVHTESSANMGREQIIVFENKEPPTNRIPQMHYTRFVGPAAAGRSGFLPK